MIFGAAAAIVPGALEFAAATDVQAAVNVLDTKPMKRPKLLFFDVNETLLDLSAMKTSVAQALDGRTDLLPLWFTTMLQYSLVATVGVNYDDFLEIGAAAMIMVARNNGVTLSQEAARRAMLPIRSLPPHPDIPSGLDQLKKAGFCMVTLTNSSQVAVDTQIKNAELMEMFEVRLSIEEVQLFKPHRHVYKWAARKMGLLPEECMLVAAHGGLARCFSFPARRSALSTGTRTGNRGTESDRSGKTPHRAGEMT
jgi:2-haloacid dehalogenase